jgi:hypothetical protein
MKKYKVVLVFGSEACELLKRGERVPEDTPGGWEEFEWDTEAERDAFLEGVNVSEGWLDVYDYEPGHEDLGLLDGYKKGE